MAFELDYAYNKEDVDVFTITGPESVSGVSGRIAGDSEATLALQYDDRRRMLCSASCAR